MKENKKSYLTKLGLRWEEMKDRYNERLVKKLKASPIGYPLFHLFVMLYFVFIIMSIVLVVNYITKPVPFEIEGSCNTGFIGIDFQSEFKNYDLNEVIKEYRLIKQFGDEINGYLSGGIDIGYYSTTPETAFVMYKTIFMPKELNLKNIDGLNCNFKVKGAIPLNQLSKVNW